MAVIERGDLLVYRLKVKCHRPGGSDAKAKPWFIDATSKLWYLLQAITITNGSSTDKSPCYIADHIEPIKALHFLQL